MKILYTFLLFLVVTSLSAQQDPLFSQYMFNKLAVNPGYAGSRENLTVDLLYRYQWVNIDGAPKTISASVHSPLNNPHLALGTHVINDRIGPMSSTSAMATFAYKIIFPKGKLSFGIQAGVKSNGIDWNKINAHDTDDPFLINKAKNTVVPDFNFGIYYYSQKFFAGFSSHQLLQNQTLVIKDEEGNMQASKLLKHFYATTGVAIPLNDNIVFRPSLLAKYVKNAPPQLDLNASFLFVNRLLLGVSYRTENAVSIMTEVTVSEIFRIGYSYDIWLNELQSYNKGSHEIRLSFDFNVKRRMLTPRYF